MTTCSSPKKLTDLMLYGRKRKRSSRISCLFIMLSLAACSTATEAFGIRRWVSRRMPSSGRTSLDSSEPVVRLADQNKANVGTSWSKSANGRRSSPLQVRKRVKAVLEKARTRTGIENSSSGAKSKPSNVVAEAASIGGLSEEYVIQIKKSSLNNGSVTNSSIDERNGSAVRKPASFPDEAFLVQKASNITMSEPGTSRKPTDFDVIRGDVPAANQFAEPLPFQLPKLSADQLRRLADGERIQEQSRMGREGAGYVVLDVQAPPYVVWECLLDFESYPDIIPTVRAMQLYTSEKLNTGYVNEKPVLPGTGRETRHYGTPSVTRASFVLSKFRLNIAAVHRYTPHPDGDYMEFTLDKSCTNMVLRGAKGIWHVKANPDGKEVRTKSSESITYIRQNLNFSLLAYRDGLVCICFVRYRYHGLYLHSLWIMLLIGQCHEQRHGLDLKLRPLRTCG